MFLCELFPNLFIFIYETYRIGGAHNYIKCIPLWSSLVAQLVKNLPAMQGMWVGSLGWEDPLEEGMATHSSILAWRIPKAEESDRLQSMGSQRVDQD